MEQFHLQVVCHSFSPGMHVDVVTILQTAVIVLCDW